eukprot:Tamp_12902.p1 GENE.Tamp_12902~~Tamp_12902.p1  ORF type:complete len:566 (+),score=87.07 Tamp_12902:64-1698(+)
MNADLWDLEDVGAGARQELLRSDAAAEPEQYNEKCGVIGIFNVEQAAHATYYGLVGLQHRGQEGAGMVTGNVGSGSTGEDFDSHKGMGLVHNVFTKEDLDNLAGNCAIGHTRYSTSGGKKAIAGYQPFSVKYSLGNLALAHNGNLSNQAELRQFFEQHGVLMQTNVDSELFLHLISHSKRRSQIDQIFDAMTQAEGAFSCVVLTDDCMVAVRDPNGFRPLVIGRMQGRGPNGSDGFCIASETCALDMCKAEYVRDVEPGEMVLISMKTVETGTFGTLQLPSKFGVSQCIFEYVYFARPDSIVFGDHVTKVRRDHGRQLAREHPVPQVPAGDPVPVVVPVPDSAAHATIGYVEENIRLGRPCIQDLGFFRNPYVGRSFIAPSQEHRDLKVRCKFNPMKAVVNDRIVILVDDSIVRGTTAKQLIALMKSAGAKEVHFRVASPPVTDPCFFGMDFPSREELFFNDHKGDISSMAQWLGVTSIGYLSAEGLVSSTLGVQPGEEEGRAGNNSGFCRACFTGDYPVPVTGAPSRTRGMTREDTFDKAIWR